MLINLFIAVNILQKELYLLILLNQFEWKIFFLDFILLLYVSNIPSDSKEDNYWDGAIPIIHNLAHKVLKSRCPRFYKIIHIYTYVFNISGLCQDFVCKDSHYCITKSENSCSEMLTYCIDKSLVCNGYANCGNEDYTDEDRCMPISYLFTLKLTFFCFNIHYSQNVLICIYNIIYIIITMFFWELNMNFI